MEHLFSFLKSINDFIKWRILKFVAKTTTKWRDMVWRGKLRRIKIDNVRMLFMQKKSLKISSNITPSALFPRLHIKIFSYSNYMLYCYCPFFNLVNMKATEQ